MQPVLFEISLGESAVFTMGAYRFFGLLAALYLLAVSWFLLRSCRLSRLKTAAVLLILAAAFLIGSRLLYALLYLPDILNNPEILVKFRLANFTMYGGLAAALMVWWLTATKLTMPFFRLTDRLAPQVGLAVAVMRAGCFLNGCCYGKVTGLPWGASFPLFSPAHLAQLQTSPAALFFPKPVHPTQLYEMAAALAAALAAWLILRKNRQEGLAAAVFGLVFTVGRLITFFYRAFPAASETSNLIRGPVVYGIAIMFFLFWVYKVRREQHP